MNRFLVAIAAGFAAALLLSSTAFAQGTSRTPNGSSDKTTSVPTDSALSRAKAVSRASVTYTALSAAMSTLNVQTSRFVRLRKMRPEHVTLVDVRNLFRNRDEHTRYEQALEQYRQQIAEMRSTLAESPVLHDLLQGRGLKLSHVSGVQTSADGRIVVFYQAE